MIGQTEIIKYLEKKGISTSKEMSIALGITQGTITGSLKKLIEKTKEVERIDVSNIANAPIPYYRLIINE